VIVDFISATTTDTGLTVWCELDTKAYPKGTVVSAQEMADTDIIPDEFDGEWNYTIRHQQRKVRAVNSRRALSVHPGTS
jgi:hypothetical protein